MIRSLKEEDIQAVERIYALYWHDDEFGKHLVARLKSVFDPEGSNIKYFVAEEDAELQGIVGFRDAPLHLLSFTTTERPAELYVLAVKNQSKGVGKILVEKMLQTAKDSGYSEVVLFSPESLKISWGFYDHLGFERVTATAAPNGEMGQIWRMPL